MKFQKEQRIQLSASRYLELVFDPEFEKRLNLEGMRIQAWDLLERSVDGPTWTLRSRITPPDNMPGFIKKLVGGTFSYEEKRTHQKGSDLVVSDTTPNVLRDKLRMGYKMRVVPDGENACRRIMDWEIEVKIFGLGGQIEKFAMGEVEKGVEASAQYINSHLPSTAPVT